jgi:hypothetical protein
MWTYINGRKAGFSDRSKGMGIFQSEGFANS